MLPTRLVNCSLLVQTNKPLVQRYLVWRTLFSSKKKERVNKNDMDDEPIKFSTSKAATWKARDSRLMWPEYWPSYQPRVVSFSIAIFLIYFCILREENDLDIIIGQSLSLLVPDMDKVQPPQVEQKKGEQKKS